MQMDIIRLTLILIILISFINEIQLVLGAQPVQCIDTSALDKEYNEKCISNYNKTDQRQRVRVTTVNDNLHSVLIQSSLVQIDKQVIVDIANRIWDDKNYHVIWPYVIDSALPSWSIQTYIAHVHEIRLLYDI